MNVTQTISAKSSVGPIRTFRLAKIGLLVLALWSLTSCAGSSSEGLTTDPDESSDWQQEFDLENRTLSDTGEGTFFILIPGFQAVLISQNERLTITVLDETKTINGISTRIVEEREERNNELYEISRNFYAIDMETGDVFYFGEDVDFYENGEIVRHTGEWLAYEDGNLPGLIMPGNPVTGMKYYQEIAPSVAMDRALVISISETYDTPAGAFEDCLVTEESSPLEPAITESKTYAPGIGLIQDQNLVLSNYGYVDDMNTK